jgi:hypothetical protein
MKTKRRLTQLSMLAALLWALPTAMQAQFTFTTSDGVATITGYTGSGGAVNIPSSTNGFPVTSIGENAFIDVFTITSVTVPDSVTSIGYEAFGMCTNLTGVTMPNSVTNIGDYGFFRCSSLTNITIPSGVTTIKVEAFGLCPSLTNVTMPNGVTNIQGGAFEDCTSLTVVTIPQNVTDIENGAFDGCSSLTGLYFQGNPPTLGANAFAGVSAAATVYYLPGSAGWGTMFDNFPAVELNPPLQISDVGVQSDEFGFSFAGTNDQVIVVQACANLATANWQPIQTNTLSGTNFNFIDSQWRNYPCRFYRLRSP